MNGSDTLIDKLAGSVSEGESIDWREAESAAGSAEERAWVRNMKAVAGIALHFRAEEPRGSGPPAAELGTWGILKLNEKVGRGRFGDVYRAWDPRLEREVALKILRRGDPHLVTEGRHQARVRHPNVATVYGAEVIDGVVGLWMEFIRGETLSTLVSRQGPFGAQEGCLIGLNVCRALAAVHGAGLVHGDVKAQNIMREEGGRIVLMDFNTGREIRDEPSDADRISGTPLYMAPEVLGGKPTSVRSDIYSLGVLLHYLTCESYPLQAKTLVDLRAAHRRSDRILLRNVRPDLPEAYLRIVERATAPDPDHRFGSAAEMQRDLAAAIDSLSGGGGGRGLGRLTIFATAVMIAAATVAVWLVPLRPGSPPSTPQTSPPVAAAPEAGVTYTVGAGLYRRSAFGSERLTPGARVAPGDELFLRFEASRDLFVYILNADDQGRTYLLFPMRGGALGNPVPAGGPHRLPGPSAADDAAAPRQLLWQVTSVGGRERFLIVASPDRLEEVEHDLQTVPRPLPTEEGSYAELTGDPNPVLRGLGGLVERTDLPPLRADSGLFERFKRLAEGPERVSGVWVRQIDLENP